MRRVFTKPIVASAAALLMAVSGSLLAQSPPTAGPGPWSQAHPLWFDMNNNGVVDPGELAGYPLGGTSCTSVVGIPAGVGATTTPCANVYLDTSGIGGTYYHQDGLVQTLSSNPTGTVFTFNETAPVPASRGVSALGRTGVKALAPASGTGTLLDTNGDGIYDTLELAGTRNGVAIPTTQVSLVLRDVTGDGRPDYITVPWTTGGAGMLGVITTVTPQIYVPLTDTDGDGWPNTITVQVVGGISTSAGPKLSGGSAAGADANAIPSVSTLGLFVFAAAVVALGVKLLRGTVAG